MSEPFSHTEQVAANLLNCEGLGLIWQLHLSAAKAHLDGRELAARSLLEIADAAERVWLRRRATSRR